MGEPLPTPRTLETMLDNLGKPDVPSEQATQADQAQSARSEVEFTPRSRVRRYLTPETFRDLHNFMLITFETTYAQLKSQL